MPGQNSWIVVLVGGVLSLGFSLVGALYADSLALALLAFGVVLIVSGVVQRNASRRFVQESMRTADEELRGEAAQVPWQHNGNI